MIEVIYSRLEEVLGSLDFSLRAVEEKNKVYRHERTGALVVLPEFSPRESVLPSLSAGARARKACSGRATRDRFPDFGLSEFVYRPGPSTSLAAQRPGAAMLRPELLPLHALGFRKPGQ